MTHYATDLGAVRSAAKRIAKLAHRTPIETCTTLDRIAGCRLFFKCEHLQKVGAFKFRGACHAVLRLDDRRAARGVVTHSSGNHGQALALAARLRGIPAHIVMPSNASPTKRAAVLEYGGIVHTCLPTLADREATVAAVQDDTGATFVHPYDDPDVISGQGTAALELLEQVADVDAIVVPVGGGGLISGVCTVASALRPALRVIGAEPQGADDAARSKAAGEWIPQDAPHTIADGLLTSLGKQTWPYVRDKVYEIITVSDDEIVHAMRLAWQRAKFLIEPSAAVAVAVAIGETFREQAASKRVAVILSGGNADLDALVGCFAKGA